MRLVRFEDEHGAFAVEFHPLLTVVSGLDPRVRDALVQTMMAIPRGADPRARGSVEVHGVYLDLNAETLELLELHQDVDVVLRAADLPGADDPLGGVQTAPSAAVAPTAPPVDPEVARRAAEDLERARTQAAELDTARHELTSSIEQLRSQLITIAQERHALAQQVESTRALLDSFAVATASAARDELAELESRAEAATGVDRDAAERAEIEARLETLIGDADRLKREVKRLQAIDVDAVREAFEQLDAALAPAETLPHPEAQDLIARWRDLDARLSAHREATSGRDDALAAAIAQRDACRTRVAEVEQALRNPPLDPALVEALEDTHDEIFELDGKASKLGGSKIRRRQEELRHREDELLTKLGFDTWSSYVMGLPSSSVSARRQATLDEARAALAQAEALVEAESSRPVEVDEVGLELAAAREQLSAEIAALLGTDPADDPTEALAALRVEAEPAEGRPDPDAAAIAVCTALEAAGTDIDPEGLDIAKVHSLASGWLEAMAALPERRAAIEQERAEIETEIEDRARRLDELAPDAGGADEHEAARREAQARLAAAEERVAQHEAAEARLAELAQQHEQLNSTERDVQFSIGERERQQAEYGEALRAALDLVRAGEEAEQERDEPRVAVPHLMGTAPLATMVAREGVRRAAGVDALEWYVLARLAQQRAISFAGSVPILIDDAFAGWSFEELDDVFARLERMSEVIQIIYLTDDPDVANWGRNLGRQRAQVLDLRSIVA